VIEQLPQERQTELYETLAFHFKQGQSMHKAIDYLVKSGEKSMNRFALEESHQYFKEAFDFLVNMPDKTKEEEGLLIDILIKWAFVFYYRAAFRDMLDLFNDYKTLAESLDDKARLGMFYSWFGFAWWARGKTKDSYEYLRQALEIGEEIEDQQVIGYTCTWLTFTSAELGRLNEAIAYGERAQEIYKYHESDQYLYIKSLGGLAWAYVFKGESNKCFEAGQAHLEYGQSHANIRSLAMGHIDMGFGYFLIGNFPSAIESSKQAIHIRADPIYSQGAGLPLGIYCLNNSQLQEAEDTLQEIVAFNENFGIECFGTPALAYLGILLIAKGQMKQGLRMVEDAQRELAMNGRKAHLALSHYAVGMLYRQIAEGSAKVSLSVALKNIGFLVKNVPFAKQKAADNLNTAIEIAEEIGAKGILGVAYLDLGLLHNVKGEKAKSREYITTAIRYFEECEADVFLQQAKEALESL
jgi:tetratricopeptide (TPR) repeat protein